VVDHLRSVWIEWQGQPGLQERFESFPHHGISSLQLYPGVVGSVREFLLVKLTGHRLLIREIEIACIHYQFVVRNLQVF